MEKMNITNRLRVQQGGPLRVHRSHSILKNKTNRLSHEEHRTRNDIGNDHGSASGVFPLFSSSFLSIHFNAEPYNPLKPPQHAYLQEKRHFGAVEARPGEQNRSPEVMSSPRRAGCLAMKPFDGPGKPDASLSKLGSRKIKKKTLLPPFLVSFCILDQNTK